jgi:hypothetical protein
MWISIIDQIKYLEKIFWASSKLLWRAIKFVMAVLPCCLHLLCPISFLSNNFYLLPSICCIFVFSFIRSIYSYGKLKPKFYINNFHIYREEFRFLVVSLEEFFVVFSDSSVPNSIRKWWWIVSSIPCSVKPRSLVKPKTITLVFATSSLCNQQ